MFSENKNRTISTARLNRHQDKLDPGAKDESGYTPLHLAASDSTGEILNLLIHSGADIEVQNNNTGCRPLHMALEGHNPVTMRALITAGADVTAKTTDGDGPIHYVTANEMEPDINDCWSPNAAVHEMLRLIVEADPIVVYALNSRGETPLHIAAKNTSRLAVVFLLQRGADRNIEDHQGKTPPLLAVETPRWETDGELKNINWY